MVRYFLYSVTSKEHASNGKRKLGLTTLPLARLRVYTTGDPPGWEKTFECVCEVCVPNRGELAALERRMHDQFSPQRLWREGGGATEWFTVPFALVDVWLRAQPQFMAALTLDDVRDVTAPNAQEAEAEAELQADPLRAEFFAAFLPKGAAPRPIQTELWEKFSALTAAGTSYRGIVQWATGTGKTIAMLMLFVLSADRCAREGRPFRGLLVAPKNDIIDTLMVHIRTLERFGIRVCEGHGGRFAHLQVPSEGHVLVTATHASLTTPEAWVRLGSLTHIHYDEVHRATGDEFFAALQQPMVSCDYVTGTSGTPQTCSPEQNRKLALLFGDPLLVLSVCDTASAVAAGYIAQPRFLVSVLQGDACLADTVAGFVGAVLAAVRDKRAAGQWGGTKVVAYLPSVEAVCLAAAAAAATAPSDCTVYSANEDERLPEGTGIDAAFLAAPATGASLHLLFACERYREGADIRGLEMTAVLMGDTIAANVLVQISGRALRLDYPGKEGWCLVARCCGVDSTPEDVLDGILLSIVDFVTSAGGVSVANARRAVATYFRDMVVQGRTLSTEETVARLQALVARRAFDGDSDGKGGAARYAVVRDLNVDLGLRSKAAYEAHRNKHPRYVDSPRVFFARHWVSWYHFLGVPCAGFPPTLADWKASCEGRGLRDRAAYDASVATQKEGEGQCLLPPEPAECYEAFTNWGDALCVARPTGRGRAA